MKKLVLIAAVLMVLGVATQIQANNLIDRGGGLIYDSDLDITWLQNAGSGGFLNWSDSNTWANNLSYYDSVRAVTYDDWRLPSSNVCVGWNCTESEMWHLYSIELGNTQQSLNSFSNVGPFTNLRPIDYGFAGRAVTDFFWTSEQGIYGGWALAFSFGGGYEYCGLNNYAPSNSLQYAWAVRDGDVFSAPPPPPPPPPNGVPEPATMMLLGLGLLGLVGVKRKIKK